MNKNEQIRISAWWFAIYGTLSTNGEQKIILLRVWNRLNRGKFKFKVCYFWSFPAFACMQHVSTSNFNSGLLTCKYLYVSAFMVNLTLKYFLASLWKYYQFLHKRSRGQLLVIYKTYLPYLKMFKSLSDLKEIIKLN